MRPELIIVCIIALVVQGAIFYSYGQHRGSQVCDEDCLKSTFFPDDLACAPVDTKLLSTQEVLIFHLSEGQRFMLTRDLMNGPQLHLQWRSDDSGLWHHHKTLCAGEIRQ